MAYKENEVRWVVRMPDGCFPAFPVYAPEYGDVLIWKALKQTEQRITQYCIGEVLQNGQIKRWDNDATSPPIYFAALRLRNPFLLVNAAAPSEMNKVRARTRASRFLVEQRRVGNLLYSDISDPWGGPIVWETDIAGRDIKRTFVNVIDPPQFNIRSRFSE